MAGYSGNKRSKEEIAAGEDDLIKQQQLENPAKLARGAWDGDASSTLVEQQQQHWKRVHHHQNSSSTVHPGAPPASGNTSSSNNNGSSNNNSSGNNPQLNFQQRVLAAAALQEIRASSPVASFKFPLDSSSTSSSGLLDHLPPLSPALPQQQTPQRSISARDQLDSLYTPLLQSLPPIVHQPLKMNNEVLSSGNASYSGLLQAPQQLQHQHQQQQQQAQMIHQPNLQIPMLPPAPGLLARDPCSWFSGSSNMNPGNNVNPSSGSMISKENLLVPPPLPPYQDVLSSLMPPLPQSLNSFGNPAPDFSEQYQQLSQQLNPPLVSNIQQQQQQQQQQQASCSYRSDMIPPAEIMFSNNNNNNTGFGSNSGSLQRTSNNKMINQQQQQVMNTNLLNGNMNMNMNMMNSGGVSGKYVSSAHHNLAGAGSSYCSSEIAASSVTSVHNAAASSSNTSGMQNGSPEDGTTLAQRIHHTQQHHTIANASNATTNHKQPPTRTFTKVYKLGSIGRAVDVTRFSNYTELRWELARMFNLEGQLDLKSGWQLVFIDHEGDILLVGDDPWEEFVTSVRGIRILSPSEVAFYTNNETGSGGAHSTLTSNGI